MLQKKIHKYTTTHLYLIHGSTIFTYSSFESCYFISKCLDTNYGILFLHFGRKPKPRTPSCIACPIFVTFIYYELHARLVIILPKSLLFITLAPLYIIFIVFAQCPGCTIRNTPSEPIHCIVWSKHLFNQLFGESGDTLHYFARGRLG